MNSERSLRRKRQGAMLVLVAVSLVAIMTVSAFAVNLAYMELCRTELRLANDAAAKAAIAKLGQMQSEAEAKQAAQRIAALHTVAGRRFALDANEIEFGYSAMDSRGKYSFATNERPFNSVRITGGGLLAQLANPVGTGRFKVSQSTVATRVDNDVCLVIDRSGSMAWDLTNTPYSYPAEQKGKSRLQNYFSRPHGSGSRWKAVQDAIAEFNKVIASGNVKVSLVTFSSKYEFGDFESETVSTDCDLTFERGALVRRLQEIGEKPIIGDTNIEAGLSEGIQLMRCSSAARKTANKTIVLLSDGCMTEGGDPTVLAATARAQNFVIHTIAFSAQADLSLMSSIAAAGGGNCYQASDLTTLRSAFRRIAESIPSIITN